MQTPTAPSARIDLYTGRLGGAQRSLACSNVAAMVVVAPLIALIIGFGVAFSSVASGIIAGIVVLLFFEGAILFSLVLVTRIAAWLDGTTLVIRSGIRTRSCDLARAPFISLQSVDEVISASTEGTSMATGRKLPQLLVKGAAGENPLRLWLANPRNGSPLEGYKLIAIANAMESGEQWVGRDMMAVQGVAAALRSRAADPKFGR